MCIHCECLDRLTLIHTHACIIVQTLIQSPEEVAGVHPNGAAVGANVSVTDLSVTDVSDVHASGADIPDALGAAKSNAVGADAVGVNIVGADVTSADAVGADVACVDVAGVSVARADALGADAFSCTHKEVTRVHPNGAAVVDANVSVADVSVTDVFDVRTSGADVVGADAVGAANADGVDAVSTDAVSHVTTIAEWEKGLWRAYVSCKLDANRCRIRDTLFANTKAAIEEKAKDWHRRACEVTPPTRKRGTAKNYGAPSRKSCRSIARGAPMEFDSVGAKRKGDFLAGPGRGHIGEMVKKMRQEKHDEGEDLVSSASKTMMQLNVQLVHLSKELKEERRENCILRGKLEAYQAAILHSHGDLDEMSREEAKVIMGDGYGDLNNKSVQHLIRTHVRHVVESVKEKAGSDALKAAQLSQAVAQRLRGQAQSFIYLFPNLI